MEEVSPLAAAYNHAVNCLDYSLKTGDYRYVKDLAAVVGILHDKLRGV